MVPEPAAIARPIDLFTPIKILLNGGINPYSTSPPVSKIKFSNCFVIVIDINI